MVDLLPWPCQCLTEQTGRLTDRQTGLRTGLQVDRAEVLRYLRNSLNKDRPEPPTSDRQKERGMKEESGKHSILQDWAQPLFNPTSISTVSRGTTERQLRACVSHSTAMLSFTETELKNHKICSSVSTKYAMFVMTIIIVLMH